MTVLEGSRTEFIENNLGLVHSCAKRFRGRGIEYDDLYSAGCIGLVKAYDGFDAERGLCFSTYAVPVIFGEIKKLFRDGGTVKVSRSVKELGLKIAAVREKYTKQTGCEPTVSQLAEMLEVSKEQAADAINACMPAVSLTPASDDDDGNREFDIPENSCEESIIDLLSLRSAMSKLDAQAKTLILLRFFKNKTQCETAAVMGISQVQVSRKERKILEAMRKELNP